MKNYHKSNAALFAARGLQEIRKLKSELNEHRYYLENKVAHRTDILTRRIALLESCNATLCGKLASYKRNSATLQAADNEAGDSSAKLYTLNPDMPRAAAG